VNDFCLLFIFFRSCFIFLTEFTIKNIIGLFCLCDDNDILLMFPLRAEKGEKEESSIVEVSVSVFY
jgi:hypothetical protein